MGPFNVPLFGRGTIPMPNLHPPPGPPMPHYEPINVFNLSPPQSGNHTPPPRATNFLSISKKNRTVKGEWTVDPSLFVDAQGRANPSHPLLPALKRGETEETRRNMHLECANAELAANLYLARHRPGPIFSTKRPCIIYVRNTNARISMSLVHTSASYLPRFY